MNERIRLLAEQAGIYKLNLSDETEYWIMENFAELIIQECAGVGYDASYYECALNVSNKIKEHFGVEE